MENIIEYLTNQKMIVVIILLSILIIGKLFKKIVLKNKKIIPGRKLGEMQKIHVVDNTIIKIREIVASKTEIEISFAMLANNKNPKRDLLKEVRARNGYGKRVEEIIMNIIKKKTARDAKISNKVVIINDASKTSFYKATIQVYSYGFG